MMLELPSLPNSPGVYWMKDRFGHILYIGKAKNLKKRVQSYFQNSRKQSLSQPKIKGMLDQIHQVEFKTVYSENEALLLEAQLIKKWQPKYNIDLTDDKKFPLIRVNILAQLPTFEIVRNRIDDGARYFGPFPQSQAVRLLLKELRNRFGILLGDTHPKKLPSGHYQLYQDMRQEIYGDNNLISVEAYHQRVQAACLFLSNKVSDYRQELECSMQKAAASHEFEKAAAFRDRLFAINQTLKPTRRFFQAIPQMPTTQATLKSLQEALGLSVCPEIIEAFDISHISGTFTVASLVRFENGRPINSQYRHYKIQLEKGNDDFQSMHQVVFRRYDRLSRNHQKLPDLILIDGGIGQVSSAYTAFKNLNIIPPPLIGLAKREETIVRLNEPPLKLAAHHHALRLLQWIRDEAHRFANRFNRELRSKKLNESILDQIPGVGSYKKTVLLKKFGSIQEIMNASLNQLQNTSGIGPKLAHVIFETFNKQ